MEIIDSCFVLRFVFAFSGGEVGVTQCEVAFSVVSKVGSDASRRASLQIISPGFRDALSLQLYHQPTETAGAESALHPP